MRFLPVSLLLSCLVVPATAQTFGDSGGGAKTITKVGTTGAQFLKIGSNTHPPLNP